MRGTRRYSRFILVFLVIPIMLGAACSDSDSKITPSGPLVPPSFTVKTDAYTGFGTSDLLHMAVPEGLAISNRLYTVDKSGEVQVLDLDGPSGSIVQVARFNVTATIGSLVPSRLSFYGDRLAVLTNSLNGAGDHKVFLFDPVSASATGDVAESVVLSSGETINYGQTYAMSDGTSSATTALEPTFPTYARIAYNAKSRKTRFFLATSNLTPTYNYGPGTVLAYDLDLKTLAIDKATRTLIKTSGFNPQAMESWRDPKTGKEYLLLVNSGTYPGGPVSYPGSVDVIDVDDEAVLANIPLGDGVPGEAAISPDGRRLFLGSAANSEVYEVDLEGLVSRMGTPGHSITLQGLALHSRANPIAIPSTAAFHLLDIEVSRDGTLLFALDFNSGELSAIDLTSANRPVAKQELIRAPTNPGPRVNFLVTRPIRYRKPQIYLGTIRANGNQSAIETVEVSR